MKTQHHSDLIEKLACLVAVAGVSVLIGFPVGAQNPGGAVNPHPSIFNEPPYNRSRSTPSAPQGTPSDNGTTTTPSTPSTPNETTTTPSTPSTPNESTTGSQDNIVAVAASNSSFKTLSAALSAAGLTQTLEGKGPFTIFAPTDQAFAQLPPNTLQQLLQPQNKDLLVKILTYHVIPGKITSNNLKSGQVETVEGSPLQVTVGNSGVMVDNAKVIKADIPASNGVIHAIDQVMLPRDLQK